MANILGRFVSHVSSIDGLDKETAVRSVVISKISPKTRDEDIVIYFQKRGNGGGELEHVRISDEGQVVITFEAREVAEGILQRRHHLNGFELELSPYRFVSQEPPEVFLQVSARVDFKVSGLSSKKSRSLLKKVQQKTNINWHEGCDGFILSGTFSQLEHSRKIFGTFFGCRSSQQSSRTESPRCAPEHLAIHENTETSNICRVEVQPQFMKLLNRAYEKEIRDMEETFCIEILWEENTSRAEIVPRKKMPNTKLYDEGCDAFISLYQKVFGEMKRDLVTLDNQEDEKVINEVIDAVTARNIVVVERLNGQLSVYGFKREINKAVKELKRILAYSNDVSQRTKHGQKEREAISGGRNNLNKAFLDKKELRHTLSNGVQISLRQGDITEEHVDAIVNAANEMLQHGGGVAGAISSKGGRQIDDDSRKVISNRGALEVGEVVYTRGGNLSCQYVVHAVGPKWKDYGRDRCIVLLRRACVESLRLAIQLKLRSIALPAISSGIFGMPKDLCARAMFDAVEEFDLSVDAQLGDLRDVRLVIIDDTTVEVFRKEFKKRFHSQGRLPARSANQSDEFGVGNPRAESSNSCEENGERVSEINTRDSIAEETKTKETPPANKDASLSESRRSSEATQRTENETAPLSKMRDGNGDSNKKEDRLHMMSTAPANNLNTAFLDKPELRHTLSNGVQISLRQGDITEERVDAIVNAANEMLRHVGRVAGAILSKGGRQIDDESRKVMSVRRALEAGEVVHTRGGNLPCQYVVHAVGPRWKDYGRDHCIVLLRRACVESLRLAIHLKLRSIALPAISSGIFGMPKDVCAGAMFDAVEEFDLSVDAQLGDLRDVRLVIIDGTTLDVFRKEFKKRYHSQGRLPTRSANQSDEFGVGNPRAESGNSCEENGERVSETNTRDPIAEATKTKTPRANKGTSSGETRRSSDVTQITENETAPPSEVGGENGNSKKMEEPLLSMSTKAEGKHSAKTLNNSKEDLSGREASETVAKTDNTNVYGKCSLMVEHGMLEAPLENRNSHGHETSGPGTAPHSKENENGDSKNIKEPLGERSERPKDEQSIRTLKEGKDSLFSEEAGVSVAKTENTETERKVSVNADQELPKGPTENPSKILPSKGRGRGVLAPCFPTRANGMAPHPQSTGQLDATTEARTLLNSSTKRPPGLFVTSEGLQLAGQGAVCEVDDSGSFAEADGNHVSNLTNAATRREGIAGSAVESEAPSEPCSDNDKTSAAEAPHNDEEGSKLDMLKRHSPSGETPETEHPNESQYVTENKLKGENRPPKVPYLLTDVPKDSKSTPKVPSEETVARLQTTSNKFDTEKSNPERLLDTARSAETAGSDPKESDSKIYALSHETSIENVRNKRSSNDEAISCNKFPKLENAEKSSQKVDSGLPRVLPSDVPSDVKPVSNVEPLDAREDEEETSFRDSTIKGEESPVASPEDATFSQGGIQKAIHPIKEKADDDSSVNITSSSDILADEDPDTPPPRYEEIKNCCDQSISCICRLPPSDPVNLPGCAYTSCSSCFEGETLCPLCNNDFPDDEIFQGRQPVGGMTWRVESRRFLPGYEGCGTIVINYNFPNGTQGPEHPNPGAPFQGRLVTSYLPDNTEGRSVLQLLMRAFKARLLFTVGPSLVDGELNQVIWNGVEHKTNVEGGPANYGYPDPSYLDRVRAELREKGVVYYGSDEETITCSDPISKRIDELATRYK